MSSGLSNGEVASLLERHGRLLVLAGESPYRARAYERAAESLRVHPEQIAVVAEEGRLRDIPGVGEGIAAAIEQIVATGLFSAHEELANRVPESLFELTGVPGVGAKTAMRLYTELGITDLSTLEAALVHGKIGATKGLGPRVEATIRSGLEAIQRRTGRTPLGLALPIARAFIAAYSSARPQDAIAIAGSVRRWEETVGDLDFVIACEDDGAVLATLATLPMASSMRQVSPRAVRLIVAGQLAADIFLTEPAAWGSTLVRATGNAAHLERLDDIGIEPSEEAVYAAHGLPLIPPELRSGRQEFDRWSEIPSLVTVADIRGEFHAHTTWSDGAASILEMARAADDRGYEVLGITDHSHGLGVAGGLSVERLTAQRKEIAAAQHEVGKRIRLLAGAEVEVHRDGSLDYADDVLAGLDVVVASLHSGLKRPREELTGRLDRVLRNPNVDIIAHPSGRLIERREGGDFDWDRVYATTAETGTALEIDADPARLDLDPERAARARAAGCLITINCDAHHPSGFAVMEYGVTVARKAWLTKETVLNCWPREDILAWLRSRG